MGSHKKRDRLLAIEHDMQAKWEKDRIFEEDADDSREKFMATFPYPYMNGRLHLGHSFSLSKVEFAVGFQRMKGKQCLFPFAFHCTGMPIKACADKLKREIEIFGNPPQFPPDDSFTVTGKHSKTIAKSDGNKYQWNIMLKMGIPEEEIPNFADASYWLGYFPPLATSDLKKLGVKVDWRRSFITTDINPYYDSFIRWQFLKLKELGKIKFGKRYTIYSPLDGQPCMDHDRTSGEGVNPQKCYLTRVLSFDFFPDKKIFVSAIDPKNDYVAIDVRGDIVICTEKVARNLSYQEFTEKEGKYDVLQRFKGSDLSKCVMGEETMMYYEPESLVMSRSGDECVVALVDQWYIDYGEPEWRAQAKKCLDQMDIPHKETRNQFETTLEWLHQWACSRSYGLGSKLPWDEQWLIESLSDSTIYMAYYTVAHLLEGRIPVEKLTSAVWDYIFLGIDCVTDDDMSLLETLRKEFNHWYPLDLRVSGKDLITNHLTFFIYNHVAIFPESKWPRSIRANGHLLLNSRKMSKNDGNFLILKDAVDKYTADATRICLADAGDSVEDANFLEDAAQSIILRLSLQIDWSREIINSSFNQRPKNIYDKIFENEINKTIMLTEQAYQKTYYREAIKIGFFDFQLIRDRYRELTQEDGMDGELIKRFVEVQALLISPIAPHFAEYIWLEILKKDTSIINASFPKAGPVDEAILDAGNYFDRVCYIFRKKNRGTATKARIFFATEYPDWQIEAVKIINSVDKNEVINVAKNNPIIRKNKKAMGFIVEMIQSGKEAKLGLLFNEKEILEQNIPYLKKMLGVTHIEIIAGETGIPGEPFINYF